MSFLPVSSIFTRYSRFIRPPSILRTLISSSKSTEFSNIDENKFSKRHIPELRLSRNISPRELQRLVSSRRYLTEIRTDDEKSQYQFSKEFVDFLIVWCSSKSREIMAGTFEAVEASNCIAFILYSMKETLKELKKKKSPRRACLDEMSRLYALGLQKLTMAEIVSEEPQKVHRILCYYADACCNFDYDPSDPDVDVWPSWFEVAKLWLVTVDSVAIWDADGAKFSQEFSKAYAYLLSIIIDVTLRFRRIEEFRGLQSAWESRISNHVSNMKERNQYILSLRMATLSQQHEVEFTDMVAKKLAKSGKQRSFEEYQFRIGQRPKPERMVGEKLKQDEQ